MPAPQAVVELVEHFKRNLTDYRSGKYNETQVRIEFVDPLFKALGWDVDNEGKRALQYQDVIHEAAIKIGEATKTPDYSFRIGGQRKFFVEAKKPSVDIRDAPSPAFQVRRYAWSAKLPISILTDFEEFAVYDCRTRPLKDDEATTARVMYLGYDEYVDRWDEIESLFSRDAVLAGDFDKFVDGFKKARGTQEVDAAFLAEIEQWREDLARNLALRNASLSQRELNFAVQRTIDRIIFLRIAEDRGIEPYNQLGNLTNSEGIYANLLRLFQRADDKYNSGLFHFKQERGRPESPDSLTPTLTIDDKVFEDILKNLYYPDSPYEFSVLPPDILGQVYEQFLGKVIRLTKGHRAKIEEKPEVKKAGGVYYTPTYIVDYIVENTVGKLVAGKTPRQVSQLRILDPACGSGSFLIGAYQYLLDWHLEQYLSSDIKAHKRLIYQGAGDEWRLKLATRKEILLNNIYGVDIDSQAVEVSKLSLLLKVLEGENQSQLSMFQERALPDLANNIKCGNSLIGPDFYADQQSSMFEMDAEERRRINVFDWETEFKAIMDAGGFDAVIGNPPYINIRILTKILGELSKKYFKENYYCAHKGYDIYVLFIEKGIDVLKKGGLLGMIVPNKIGGLDYAFNCRSLILKQTSIVNITDVSNINVFGNVGVYPYIITLKNSQPRDDNITNILIADSIASLKNRGITSNIPQRKFSAEDGFSIHKSISVEDRVKTQKLKARAKLHSGTTGFSAQKIAAELLEVDHASDEYFNFIVSGNIDRYSVELGNVRYMKKVYSMPVLLKKSSMLSQNKVALYSEEKIIFAGMTLRIEASFYTGSLALGVQVYAAADYLDNPKYLLGVLNSRLLSYLFRTRFQSKHLAGGYLAINKSQLEKLPIRTIDFDNPSEVAQHDKIVSLVESMLSLHKQLAKARIEQDKTPIQRQIEATDKEIDKLVYELYDLTEEEIKIVEESVGG